MKIRFPAPFLSKHRMRAMKDDLLALRYDYCLQNVDVSIFFDIEERRPMSVKGVVVIVFKSTTSEKTMDDIGTRAYEILCMHCE